MTEFEVLIVGAGPTGLVLALWLAKQGVKVGIVDKAHAPGTTSRAMVVQARTLELYRQLDLADAVALAGGKNPAINLWAQGQQKARVSFQDAGIGLTPFPYVLVYPQDQHERLLIQRLSALGVTVQRETELTHFQDHGDFVHARLKTAQGQESECKAQFLAACDGARSPVRHMLGVGFEGGTYDQIFYVADVKIGGPPANGEAHVSLASSDFVVLFPYGNDGLARLIGTVQPERAQRAQTLTFDDVGHQAMESLGLRVQHVNWFSTYKVHHRVTDRYRVGRVFLLGDAAHVHSPVGGQGMNTGIGDSINLAWKLASVLKQQASETLLDSYETERLAFAKRLVATTDRMFTFVTADGSFANFMRTRIAPLFAGAAFELESVREMLFRIVSQTGIHYHESPLSEGQAGKIQGGDRLPWVVANGHDNYAPLDAIAWQVHVYGNAQPALRSWCEQTGIALHEYAWSQAHKDAGLLQDAIYLLRPDTYVALASKNTSPTVLDQYFRDRGLGIYD